MEAIFHRTSIRQFQNKAVEPEKVEKLMRAALQAPSAGNQQPAEFYIVTNPAVLEELSKASPYTGCTKNAPMAIVGCYRKEVMMPEYAEIDMAIATENIMLEADYLGLGSVMLGIAPHEDRMENVRKAIGVPEDLVPFTVIPVGYPVKVNPQRSRYDESRIHYVK